jgi:prepilin-type N-terminal cleavage/methylation domain-containing protein
MTMSERNGFTLIEILIVVAIIAILASVVLVGLGPTQQAGRDARRISDLHEVQNGLELYYNKCGYYPGTSAASPCVAGTDTATLGYAGMSTALIGSNIGISSIPLDPSNAGTHVYGFATPGADAATYVLSAVLEDPNNSVFTSYTAPSGYAANTSPAAPKCDPTGDSLPGAYCISL